MKITRNSMISNKQRTREIDITEEQLNQWKAGEVIQNVAPHLSNNDREFLITGITEEEWDEVMLEPEVFNDLEENDNVF